ncbi:MAG: diguanylate cyclase [Thiogranum sp.]|nr:diguanylate cyclase [Thiogranum sp.]
MSITGSDGVEAAGVRKILCLLESLRQSPTGGVIYRQVERMLEDVMVSRGTSERAYIALVNQLLDAYAGHLRRGSMLQVQIRLLQARLQPPLTANDLAVLQEYVELYATQIDSLQDLDTGVLQKAVDPLLQAFGISDAPVAESAPEPEQAASEETVAATPPVEPPSVAHEPARTVEPVKSLLDSEWPFVEPKEQPARDEQSAVRHEMRTDELPEMDALENDEETSGSSSELQVDTAYRSHLDSKRRDIQKLQSTLAQQVLGTIAQNEEFGVLLEVVLGELRQAGDGKELEDLRWTLIREIEKLTKGHHDLAEKLDSTHHYLQLIESDSRQLNDELTRVRLLSLTDELTGLPNRRAFLRRIEDEVARVQRYGFPLSLALIDLDHFKQVNDKFGHAGGDEVLQIYAKNILSIFRHHDLVARYGGEEFAVLLPNTDAEGSLRALTKVRNRALETRWQANGDLIQVPTFSSGVSLYKPGETASAFIERADKALYRAKHLGRDRVELDATYRSEAASEVQPGSSSVNEQRQHRES